MDVGLNNKNKLHLALNNDFLKDVEWVIEATDTEQYYLWEKYHETRNWNSAGVGYSYSILELNVDVPQKGITIKKRKKEKLEICINFNFTTVDGHKILFYECSSLLAHYGYIQAFLLTYFQRTHDNYTRWNHTDAMNFHNCINYLDTVDIEPRDTVYKDSSFKKDYFIFDEI